MTAPRPAPQAEPFGEFQVFPTVIPPGRFCWRLVADGVTFTSRTSFVDPDAATADAVAVRDAASGAPVTRVATLMSGAGR